MVAFDPDPVRRRVIAFQSNTSARTPEELDNLPDIESTEPRAFSDSVVALMRGSSVRVVGGCCGTDESHIEAPASAVSPLIERG